MNVLKGYKETEIGLLPIDWELKSVGTHCIVKARIGWQGLRSDEYLSSGKYGLITSTDIVDGRVNWGSCCFVSKSRYLQDSNIIVREDDTLVSKDGTIGKVGIVQNIPFPSTLNSGVFVIRPKFDDIYKKYLAFAFKSVYFQDFINRLTAGSTIVHLYQKDIVNFKFPVPPPLEQRAIAEVLSDVDGLIGALDKKIAKKRLIKQGTMQQLLTGEKRLPGFTDKWVAKKLGKISHIKTGSRNGDQAIENGKYPFFVRSQKVYAIDTYSFDGEAILVPGEGGIGNIFHYINGKFDFHQRVYKISGFADEVCGKFIYFYMSRYFGEYALSLTVKATVDSLRLPTFEEFVIFMPSDIKEQQSIATILSDMDKEITDLEAQRDKYRLLKSDMMQKLLTGQIRLRTK